MNKTNCTGCGACAASCPVRCITMHKDKLGFAYPKTDETKCIDCRLCKEVCLEQINPEVPALQREEYAMIAKDCEVRQASSSGGIFYLMAREIILNNGVVFGAAFNDTYYAVKHIAVETEAELKKLQGAKYVQSELGNTFFDVQEYLDRGRTVLFSGTPCQIAGLKAFLGEEYPNLFLLDLICHGVPAPAVWEAYVKDLEKCFAGKVIKVTFRNKDAGWRNYRIILEFDNGRIYTSEYSKDPYMRGFLKNLYLRPCCYACKYKGGRRVSDITLGDYWGVESIHPQFNDNMGVSAVIVSTTKGKFLYEKITAATTSEPTRMEFIARYNPALLQAVIDNPRRNKFVTEFQEKSIRRLLNKYCMYPLSKRIWRKLKSIVKRRILMEQ